jgi:hypothetical protein
MSRLRSKQRNTACWYAGGFQAHVAPAPPTFTLQFRRTSHQQLPLKQCACRTASFVSVQQHFAQQRFVQGKGNF